MHIYLVPLQFFADSTTTFYFLLFCLIDRTLQKILMGHKIVLVVLKCPTQPSHNSFHGMSSQEPYMVTQHKKVSFYHKGQGIEPHVGETYSSDRRGVSNIFLSLGFDNNTAEILMTSWRKKAFSNYSLYMST